MTTHGFPPLRGLREGEVSPSYGDGGVISAGTDIHDPLCLEFLAEYANGRLLEASRPSSTVSP